NYQYPHTLSRYFTLILLFLSTAPSPTASYTLSLHDALPIFLVLDVGGSMDPHAHVCERLFSAASRATHFKELRTHYFHNCVYGRVYESAALMRGVPVLQLLQDCDPSWRLIVVGDALMSPWEL